jgi:hypothetical protein
MNQGTHAALVTGLFSLWMLAPSQAHAQSIVVNIDETQAEQYGLDASGLESNLNSTVSDQLNIGEQAAFLTGMANAAALATKGMGVDYASNPKRVVFGGSFGTAVNGVGASFKRGEYAVPEGGFSLQASLMAGINLGFGNEDSALSRFRLYANGLALGTSGDSFNASVYNYGAHLQVQLLKPRQAAVLEWGGLAVTSGYEVSGYVMELTSALPVVTEQDGVELSWDATGAYDIVSVSDTIPVEVSTNLRVFVATIFVGGGVDLVSAGSATSEISLGGDINASAAGQDATLGNIAVSLAEEGFADDMVPRAFVGAQADLLFIKAYGQLNIGFNESFGGHVGLRVVL